MAAFLEMDPVSEDLANKILDLNSDVFKWVLTNTAPAAGTNFLLASITQIATSGGYTQMTDGAGGIATTLSFSRTGQTTTVSHTTGVFTATGAVGPFRYVCLVDDTPTAGGGAGAPGANPIIGYFDHGSNITMANTDTYTITNGAVFTIN